MPSRTSISAGAASTASPIQVGRSITKAMRIGTGEETRNGRHFSSGLASLHLDFFEMMLNVGQHQTSPGVGKLRPAGQIRPAEIFCLVRGVVFQGKLVILHKIILLVVLCLVKAMSPRAQNCFKTARGPKKLPTPGLGYCITSQY